MTADTKQIVIVGGGQAAARAAQAARLAGYAGSIVLLSDEAHVPYERPPLSKECLKADGAGLKPVLPRSFYDEHDVDLRLGATVTEIDRSRQRVRIGDADEIAYDRLLLATGGSLRRLEAPGMSGTNVFYLRTFDDSARLLQTLKARGRLLVIGAGFIGLEIAAAARRLTCEVTVVEAADRILGRVAPPEVSSFVEQRHRREGVDIRLGVTPLSTTTDATGSVRSVELSSGERLDVGAVAIGIGIVPNCGLADRAGLDIANGIRVDECCRTSDDAIFAAGDVAIQYNPVTRCELRQESWQNAQDQGSSAGSGLAGSPQPVTAVPWAWSDHYDLNLQVAGTRMAGDRIVVRGDPGADGFSAVFLDGPRMRGAVTLNRGREMTAFKRMLAQGATPDAEHLRDESVNLRSLMRA